MSDQQAAFVTGISAEFPGGPHRYGVHHLLRDFAKPRLAAASHATVTMRRTVRGRRAMEREVLQPRRGSAGEPPAGAPAPPPPAPPPPANQWATAVPVATDPPAPAGEVVLDSGSAVRGIRHEDQGGGSPQD